MGAPLPNWINVMGCYACRVRRAMLLYLVGAPRVIAGQYGVAACHEICNDVTARMGEVKDWMMNFDMRIIKCDRSAEIRRQLARQHNRTQERDRSR